MKKIVMYSTSSCPHCKSARAYLRTRKVELIEKDINMDHQARHELAQKNIMSVPAFIIDDEIIVGFDRSRIDRLLSFEIVKCQACSSKLRLPAGKGKIKVKCPACSAAFIIET